VEGESFYKKLRFLSTSGDIIQIKDFQVGQAVLQQGGLAGLSGTGYQNNGECLADVVHHTREMSVNIGHIRNSKLPV
jgi:hypothetical protein